MQQKETKCLYFSLFFYMWEAVVHMPAFDTFDDRGVDVSYTFLYIVEMGTKVKIFLTSLWSVCSLFFLLQNRLLACPAEKGIPF
jgi:hypothetical protein